MQKNLAIIRRNLGLLEQFIDRYGGLFEWGRPKAGQAPLPPTAMHQCAAITTSTPPRARVANGHQHSETFPEGGGPPAGEGAAPLQAGALLCG